MAQASIIVRDVRASYPDRAVFDGVTFTASPGTRLGLIGENGSGKSTLLRVLAGIKAHESGHVSAPDEVIYVDQEPSFDPERTVDEVFAGALAPLHRAVAEVERLGELLAQPGSDPRLNPARYDAIATQYADAMEWAIDHHAWDAERRARITAHSLGVAQLSGYTAVKTLSGGQKSRLALAAALTRLPQLLLLDEPTNHLDDAARATLLNYLREYPGVLIVASHDRSFLGRACTSLYDLDAGYRGVDGEGGGLFGGTFTEYRTAQQASKDRWAREYRDQQDEIARLRGQANQEPGSIAHNRGPRDNDRFIYSFKGENVDRTLSRRVRSAQQRLAVIERDPVPRPPEPLRFEANLTARPATETDADTKTDTHTETAPQPEPAVEVTDLAVRGRLRLRELSLDPGEKLLVTGPNASGKSTLLAVLAGEIAPDRGRVRVRGRIGLLGQDTRFEDPHSTVRDTFERATQHDVQALAHMGLLRERDLERPAAQLSIGQQKRVQLAILVARQPDILLLDEPTNHLSLTLVDELEDALRTAPGTVIIATHDLWLRERWPFRTLRLG